jgi:hypothetical protein
MFKLWILTTKNNGFNLSGQFSLSNIADLSKDVDIAYVYLLYQLLIIDDMVYIAFLSMQLYLQKQGVSSILQGQPSELLNQRRMTLTV